MKKYLLIFLTIMTLFGCQKTPALQRAENEHDIFIMADPHYINPSLSQGPKFVEMVENNADGRLSIYCEELMDAWIETCLAKKPEVVMIVGDITFNGEVYSHESIAKKLEKLKQAGIIPLVIPGNHDIENARAYNYSNDPVTYSRTITKEDFEQIYQNCGYNDAYRKDPSSLSYVYKLNDKSWLLMLDTCMYETNTAFSSNVGGTIREPQLEWIEEVLKEADAAGATVLSATHHTLAQMVNGENYQIKNARTLAALLTKYHVPINFCGHTHVQYYKPVETDNGVIYDMMTSSYMINPHQYGYLRWVEDDSLHYVTELVDVEGYAKKHRIKDPFFTNFQENAREYFKVNSTSRIRYLFELEELDQETQEALRDLKGEENVYVFSGHIPAFKEYFDQTGLEELILTLPEQSRDMLMREFTLFKYDGNELHIDLKE